MIEFRDKDEDEGLLRDLAPDLTPLIDIVFILIVFLILTSNPAVMELIVDLPEKGTSTLEVATESSSYKLQIKPNEQFFYKGSKVSSGELKTLLADDFMNVKDSDGKEKELIIASDKSVKVENFLSILTIIEELQIKNIRILMGDGQK